MFLQLVDGGRDEISQLTNFTYVLGYTIQLDQPLEPGLGLLRMALRRGCPVST